MQRRGSAWCPFPPLRRIRPWTERLLARLLWSSAQTERELGCKMDGMLTDQTDKDVKKNVVRRWLYTNGELGSPPLRRSISPDYQQFSCRQKLFSDWGFDYSIVSVDTQQMELYLNEGVGRILNHPSVWKINSAWAEILIIKNHRPTGVRFSDYLSQFITITQLLSFFSAERSPTPGWAQAGSPWPSPWSCVTASTCTEWWPLTSAGETVPQMLHQN